MDFSRISLIFSFEVLYICDLSHVIYIIHVIPNLPPPIDIFVVERHKVLTVRDSVIV